MMRGMKVAKMKECPLVEGGRKSPLFSFLLFVISVLFFYLLHLFFLFLCLWSCLLNSNNTQTTQKHLSTVTSLRQGCHPCLIPFMVPVIHSWHLRDPCQHTDFEEGILWEKQSETSCYP